MFLFVKKKSYLVVLIYQIIFCKKKKIYEIYWSIETP